MSTSVSYPAGIASALGHLYTSRNSIEVFVEDTSSISMWRAILRRFLPENAKFQDPIPLGGRERVLDECRNDQSDDSRKKIYIIDADMDLLLNKPRPQLKYLYRINAYCIENYLFSKKPIAELVEILNPNISAADVELHLDLEIWLSNQRTSLYHLFVCYAVNSSLNGGLDSVSYHVSRLTLDHPQKDIVCNRKIRSRVFRMYRNLTLRFGIEAVRDERNKITSATDESFIEKLVSGKSYLLPLIFYRLRREFGGGMSDDQMKVVLAKNVDVAVDKTLQSVLHAISN